MSEPKIGRALASGLHQAISELMPTRVEFYESWLTPGRIRKGELGRARVAAVLSFLRQEGADYDAVVRRAGRYTADWTVDTLPAVERAVVRRLPRPLRIRAVLRAARRLIRQLHADNDLRSTVRRGIAVVELEGSLFCDVRERAQAPLCGFYAALLDRYFEFFGLPGAALVARCRGTGEPSCELVFDTTVAPPSATAGTTLEVDGADRGESD
jgi:predicted hydrocarbon binding protein